MHLEFNILFFFFFLPNREVNTISLLVKEGTEHKSNEQGTPRQESHSLHKLKRHTSPARSSNQCQVCIAEHVGKKENLLSHMVDKYHVFTIADVNTTNFIQMVIKAQAL